MAAPIRAASIAIMMIALSPVGGARASSDCSQPLTLPGSNVSGGEFNSGKPAARYAYDYIYPGPNEIALMRRLGLRLMRVPFAWERLQPTPLGPLDPAELARLDEVVALAEGARLVVALEPHNYGMYAGQSLDDPNAERGLLPDLWKRLARHFGGNESVVFDLMNEPKDVETKAWAEIAATTLAAIRTTGARNVVLVPGTHWDGAQSWFDGGPGASNADALLPLARNDPAVVFEVHQYFDENFSGTSPSCGASSRVPGFLSRVGAWARANHVRVMLGEFGVSRQPECLKGLDDALAVIEADRDAWYGWTYWTAGAWWGDYPFNIQPPSGDAPQAGILKARAESLSRLQCVKDQ